ncbi:hypothetical protein J6590_007577 [Homalodisca vitripennis]|nr:hypothetical protein J6590_007577 [Homalodisca vitripennis]
MHLSLKGLWRTPEAHHEAYQSMISAVPQTSKDNLSDIRGFRGFNLLRRLSGWSYKEIPGGLMLPWVKTLRRSLSEDVVFIPQFANLMGQPDLSYDKRFGHYRARNIIFSEKISEMSNIRAFCRLTMEDRAKSH